MQFTINWGLQIAYIVPLKSMLLLCEINEKVKHCYVLGYHIINKNNK